MIKLPFFQKKNHSNNSKFLVLDINSDHVKAQCIYKEDTNLKIVGYGKESLEPGTVRNGIIIDFDTVESATQQAIQQATAEIEDTVKDLIVGVTSDIALETVTTAKISRVSENPITQKEIQEFEKKIFDSAYLQMQSRYSETSGNDEEDFKLILSTLVYSKIDGKLREGLLEQSGNVIEMAMYTAYSPLYFLSTVNKLAKHLNLNLLAITPQNHALIRGLQHSENEDNDMVIIQVGTDFTNVGVVFGKATVTNKSLPIGKKHFVEEVSRIMGLTTKEATRVVDSHSKGELSNTESGIVQDCLKNVLDLWLEGIELLFANFSGVKTFAPHVYLYGEGTTLPEIEETLSKEPWTKAIPFKSPPTIQTLQISDLANITDATGDSHLQNGIIPSILAYIYEEL